MPTAGLLFIALIALYIAASGKAKKILEALGAKAGDAGGAPADTGTGTGDTPTGLDLLSNNAQLYNQMRDNPGSTNNNNDNPLLQTNFGVNWDDILGYYTQKPVYGSGGSGDTGLIGPPVGDDGNLGHYTIGDFLGSDLSHRLPAYGNQPGAQIGGANPLPFISGGGSGGLGTYTIDQPGNAIYLGPGIGIVGSGNKPPAQIAGTSPINKIRPLPLVR